MPVPPLTVYCRGGLVSSCKLDIESSERLLETGEDVDELEKLLKVRDAELLAASKVAPKFICGDCCKGDSIQSQVFLNGLVRVDDSQTPCQVGKCINGTPNSLRYLMKCAK